MEISQRQGSVAALGDRDPSDDMRRAVELAQRGRIILDVATADLAAAEATLGAFHPTTWYFRNALDEARRSWDRLRAEFGLRALERALASPPLAVMSLRDASPDSTHLLIAIEGKTYSAERVAGTPLAPVQWRIDRIGDPLEHGPYYACRLADGSTQCDCAEWTYRVAEAASLDAHAQPCKHLHALLNLGWLEFGRRGSYDDR